MKHTKVLLYGNVGYIDRAFLKKAFREVNVLILGESQLNQSFIPGVTILPFSGETREIYEVFDSYEFDQIVYFSNYLSYKREVFGEVERLKTLLELCRSQENVRFLYIDGPFVDSGIYENTVIQKSIYNLIEEYSSAYHVDIKLIYIPYLYSLHYKKDYIHQMTENLTQLDQFQIHEDPDHVVPFISLEDLADLVYKILDSWKEGKHILAVEDPFKVPIHELVELMTNQNRDIRVQYGGEHFSILLPKSEVDVRKEYGWFPRYSILAEYRNLYNEYTKVGAFSKKVLKKKKGKSQGFPVYFRKMSEIFFWFLLVEFLQFFANTAGQLENLDFRLVLVAVVSIQYGAAFGILASVLASVGFVFSYLILGNNWHTLFYNLDSWMPIVVYLFVGSICGYFQMRKHDDFELLQYEKAKLEAKYHFKNQLYSDIILDKKMMKNEITSMRAGMGKISSVIEKLSKCGFSEIGEAVREIMNEWFETKSAEFYVFRKISDNQYEFERNVVDFKKFPEIEKEVFEAGFFANSSAIPDYPIYTSLIHIAKNLYGLIWIEQVPPEHITLYDRNTLLLLTRIIEPIMTKKYFQSPEGDRENKEDVIKNH